MLRFLFISAFLALSVGTIPKLHRLRLDGRLVSRTSVQIQQYPYHVSLQYYESHICSGSIIDKNKILTAAHCTDGTSARLLTIRHSSTYTGSFGEVIKIASIAQHPGYNPFEISSDVSVLTLQNCINASAIAKPIPLVAASALEGGRKGISTHWCGFSSKLQAFEVDEIDRNQCKEDYGITDTMICFTAFGKDSCQCDSGGPLVANCVQVGIVSWGYGCFDPTYPGIYSHVAALRNFIDSH